MTKRRTGDPWMPAPRYARTLEGLTVNLLVRDIAATLPFQLVDIPDLLSLQIIPSE